MYQVPRFSVSISQTRIQRLPWIYLGQLFEKNHTLPTGSLIVLTNFSCWFWTHFKWGLSEVKDRLKCFIDSVSFSLPISFAAVTTAFLAGFDQSRHMSTSSLDTAWTRSCVSNWLKWLCQDARHWVFPKQQCSLPATLFIYFGQWKSCSLSVRNEAERALRHSQYSW